MNDQRSPGATMDRRAFLAVSGGVAGSTLAVPVRAASGSSSSGGSDDREILLRKVATVQPYDVIVCRQINRAGLICQQLCPN